VANAAYWKIIALRLNTSPYDDVNLYLQTRKGGIDDALLLKAAQRDAITNFKAFWGLGAPTTVSCQFL